MCFTVMQKSALMVDGRLTEKENLTLAEKYWENKDFDEISILEMLVDGDIEVVEIVKEKCYD